MKKRPIGALLLLCLANPECSVCWTWIAPPTLGLRVRNRRWTSLVPVYCSKNQSSAAKTKPGHRNQHVWRAADRLAATMPFHTLTPAVTEILRHWGTQWADNDTQQNLLNKANLLHEVEESVFALGLLMEWLDSPSFKNNYEMIDLIDLCCGKGICSLLASYLFANDTRIASIVMMDKPDNAQDGSGSLDWSHVGTANAFAEMDNRPLIITHKENLFETDKIVNWLSKKEVPIAFIGIHLCKNLSPTFIGIANALGPSKVPFLCLAPCCLPRVVVQSRKKPKNRLEVAQHELPLQRQARLRADQLRRNARKRHSSSTRKCILCESTEHTVGQCSRLASYSDSEQVSIFQRASELEPCWKCGEIGHQKKDCPSTQASNVPALIRQPVFQKDVSHIMHTANPFAAYCGLLSTTIERESVLVVESEVQKTESSLLDHGTNWNRDRKTIYIVAGE